MEKIKNPCMRSINWSDGEGELNKIKKCKLKIKTKMLYVEHKKIFIKNAMFFLPQKTRGPVNRSLGPTKSHA